MSSGLAYPFRFQNGKVAMSSGVTRINEKIQFVLGLGEHEVFMSDIGTKIRNLAFDSNQQIFEASAETYIADSLAKNIVEIELILAVNFNWDIDNHKVTIGILYIPRGNEPTETSYVMNLKGVS